MSKVRIYSLAKELGLETQKMLELLDTLGVEYKSHSSTLDDDLVETIKGMVAEQKAESAVPSSEPVAGIPVSSDPASSAPSTPTPTAQTEGKRETPITQTAPSETAVATQERESDVAVQTPPADLMPHRAPVVTIMGHVDHGKTSLLDYIRKTKVAAKEAGGITQHVGAFEAQTSRGKVVFIDTPGHEAFTTIRARGAKVADIAIIVVAADDSIMPQTREAIAHAQAAKVPIIVAINKVDLPQADPDRVKTDLTQVNLVPEDFGGDTIVVNVSAKTGVGIEELLEYISLTAEIEDLRADPNGEFKGVVISSKVDKQMGVLTNLMVQAGTLNVGEFLVVGEGYGKIKAMTNTAGERIKSAGPSTPVQVLGFSVVPHPGEQAARAKDEHGARDLIAGRVDVRRDLEALTLESKKRLLTLAEVMGSLEQIREVNLILRADTQDSLEAIQYILSKYGNEDVVVNVLLAGVGAPSEGDVLLASTAEATILCFNVTAPGGVQRAADSRGISLKTYRIVYELEQEVERLLKGTVEPVFEERYLGRAEVRMVIPVPKVGHSIAGSYIQDGLFRRNAKAKVSRKGKVVFEGTLIGLKRFKDDAREVTQGYECGVNMDWDGFEVGDLIEAVEMVEVK